MKTEAENTPPRRIQLLVLEDRAVDAEIMIRKLRRAGFDPVWSLVQTEADFTAQLRPQVDVILADFNLPTFDGLRALDLVRDSGLDIPCIIVSGSIGDERAAECIRRGAVDYLLKDRLGRLGQAVSQALKDRHLRARSQAAAAALQRSEERFSKAFHSSPSALTISRRKDEAILEVNRAFLQLFGCVSEEVAGRTLSDLKLVDHEAIERFRARLNAMGSLSNHEMQMRTARGGLLSVLVSTEVVEVEAEACVLTTVVDITEPKRAEARMELEYAVTRVLADNAPLRPTALKVLEIIGQVLEWEVGTLWAVDLPSTTLRCVEVWHRPSARLDPLAAITRKMVLACDEGLPGRVWASREAFWTVNLAEHAGVRRRAAALGAGLQSVAGFPILLRDEVLGVVEFFSAKNFDPDARVLTLMATLGTQIGQFIERQQLEEQYRHAQKMEAIGTLAGGIAHDFNNILTAIRGYAEFAKMDAAGNKPVEDSLDAVVAAAARATDLVRQILTFSQPQPQPQRREVVQLQGVVAEVLKLLRATIPATIEMETVFGEDVACVLADTTQIHQVLMNLGTNAAYAMKEQAGILGTRLENFVIDHDFVQARPLLKPGRYVRLSVSDTGHGMDQVTIARIFEPFFTTKAPGEGTGLGLAVVHGIMLGHDGAISVESLPGNGTTFHLYFPAHGDALPRVRAEEERGVPMGRGERILLVDDEKSLALLGKKILERLGYVVDAHDTPMEALNAFRESPAAYDLMVTDLIMPTMTGMKLASHVLQIRPELPVVLTTGYGATLTLESAQAAGIRELLMKPHSILSLGLAVHRVLADKRGSLGSAL